MELPRFSVFCYVMYYIIIYYGRLQAIPTYRVYQVSDTISIYVNACVLMVNAKSFKLCKASYPIVHFTIT